MAVAPENTLESISRALDAGVDMVEVDIALCRSGEVVLLHDDRLDRTTDGSGYVADWNFDELRRLDAGSGQRIPTLTEVIDLVDRRCPLNVEIKGRGSAREVSRILREYIRSGKRREEDFMVSSFDHPELKQFHSLYPEIRISPITSCHPLSFSQIIGDLPVWSLNMKREFVSREIVEEAHRWGAKILVFTINKPEELEKMRAIGVDGVFTNDRLELEQRS
jgi:glycerophosphoryl diester phosphodiesterase